MFEELSGKNLSEIPRGAHNDSSDVTEEDNEELNTPIYPDPDDKTVYKIILEQGEGTEKPSKLDKLEIQIEKPEETTTETLELTNQPESYSKLLRTMKKNELSELHIKEEIYKVKLIDWVSISDILEDGSMIKTILKRGIGYDLIEYKDDVKLNIKVSQLDSVLLNEDRIVSCESPLIPTGLYELLKTMKLLEQASIQIKNSYYKESFPGYGDILNDTDITLYINILDLKKVEDMYLDGSFYKKVAVEGEGKNIPNSNAIVRIRYKLEIESQAVLNNFDGDLLQIYMDEDEVPSLWTHCLRQMKEGDIVKVECNMMGLHSSYLNDGLDPKYNYETYARPNVHSCVFTIELVSFDMGKVNYNMTYEDRCNEANRIKEAGNKVFKASRYERALEKYEAANSSLEPINDCPSLFRPIHFLLCGNITLCNLRMEKWHEAETHARKILDYNPNDTKALYRRALARSGLQNYEAALNDLKNAKRVSEEKNDKEMLAAINKEIIKINAITKKTREKEKGIYKNLFQ